MVTGFNALNGNKGNDNVATGSAALYENTGSSNVATGSAALYQNRGDNNVATGTNALNGNEGDNNVATGVGALASNTLGNNNVATGAGALANNTTGNDNVAIGYKACQTTNFNNTICIGANTSVNDNNQIRLGDDQIVKAYIHVPWNTTSDKRLKENITSLNDGLSFISELNPVTYNFINDSREKNMHMGLIAQEVESSLNKYGLTTMSMVSSNGEGMLGLRYTDLLAPLISSVKELNEELKLVKEELAALKNN